MEGYFELLTEKEVMWAEVLMRVLNDHGIYATALPVYGAVLALEGGVRERLEVYVPKKELEKAKQLMKELFPEVETEK